MEKIINKSRNCDNPIGSDCIQWSGRTCFPCLVLCPKPTITQVVEAEIELVCNLINEFNALSLRVNTPAPIINFGQLTWGCVYPSVVKTYQCNCPGYPIFIADNSAPNGIGYCNNSLNQTDPNCIPLVITTTAVMPNTLLGVLQTMINFMQTLCCNPCSKNP